MGKCSAALFAALFLTGCGDPEETPSTLSVASESNAYTLIVTDGLSPRVGRRTLGFTVDTENQVSEISMEPWMPAHGHGSPEQPSLVGASGEDWQASNIVYTMPGHWELRLAMTLKGTEEHFIIPVDVR